MPPFPPNNLPATIPETPPAGGLSTKQLAESSTLAKTAFGLGVASLLFGLTSLPAIVCGHLALARSKRSPDHAGDGPAARVALTLGYLCLLIVLLSLGALLWFMPPGYFQQRRFLRQSLSDGQQIAAAIRAYAREHDATTPPGLDALFPKYLPDRAILLNSNVPDQARFRYVAPGIKLPPEDPKRVLIRSLYTLPRHQAVFVYADGTGEIRRDVQED